MDRDDGAAVQRPANAQTSALEAFTTADPDREWTVREIARHAAIGGRGPVMVGSAEEVAGELRDWVEETGIDGFNLAYALTPGTFVDMADLVVPELQSRGLFKRDYVARHISGKAVRRGSEAAGQPSRGGGSHGPLTRHARSGPARASEAAFLTVAARAHLLHIGLERYRARRNAGEM